MTDVQGYSYSRNKGDVEEVDKGLKIVESVMQMLRNGIVSQIVI